MGGRVISIISGHPACFVRRLTHETYRDARAWLALPPAATAGLPAARRAVRARRALPARHRPNGRARHRRRPLRARKPQLREVRATPRLGRARSILQPANGHGPESTRTPLSCGLVAIIFATRVWRRVMWGTAGSELAERGFVTLAPSYPLLANYQLDPRACGFECGTMMVPCPPRLPSPMFRSRAHVDVYPFMPPWTTVTSGAQAVDDSVGECWRGQLHVLNLVSD